MQSYEQGEITLKLTEEEVAFLSSALETVANHYQFEAVMGEVKTFDNLAIKIDDLFEDHCIKYSLSPALVAYNAKYGTWGTGEDQERWETFRDAYNIALSDLAKSTVE